MNDEIAAGEVTVLVVDDQAPFRRAARSVIARAETFRVVGEAETGEDAVALAEALRPALVLMDVNLPGISGIEATRRIVAADADIVVVLCSTYPFADLPADARVSGAAAYLDKEALSPTVVADLWEHRHDGFAVVSS